MHLFFVGDIVGLLVDGTLVVGEDDEGDKEGFTVVAFGVGETLGGLSFANTEICSSQSGLLGGLVVVVVVS